jgi:hypothetical protein
MRHYPASTPDTQKIGLVKAWISQAASIIRIDRLRASHLQKRSRFCSMRTHPCMRAADSYRLDR